MKKERFDLFKKHGITKMDEKEIIKSLVDKLIEYLFKPSLEQEYILDKERIKQFDIDDSEPINWGAVKCIEVDKQNDGYLVTIDEAAPRYCPTFCEYIEKYMHAWGWDIKCQTEW